MDCHMIQCSSLSFVMTNPHNIAIAVTPQGASKWGPYREVLGLALLLVVYVALIETRIIQATGEARQMLLTSGWLYLGARMYCACLPMRLLKLPGYRFTAIVLTVLCLLFCLRIQFDYSFAWSMRTRMFPTLLLVLFVPVAEETYFRGVLLDHIATHINGLAAVFLVSVFFGLMHYPQGHWFIMALLSAFLSSITIRSRQVGWAIALHGTWNLLAVQP